MGKKKAVEPPPPPPASWSETLSAYTAYFTDSASEMLHSVTGRSRGGISSPPANKKKKQTNVKKAKPAAPTKKKQQQRPEKGGSKKRGADVAPAVSSTTVLIDTLHKYSDGVKTLAANSTVRAQQLSQTAGAHARAAKTRALDTSRRSTARVGQALGRDDLHEHAAAGVVALAILVAAILYWLYPRLRGSWGGDSTKTGREGGGLVSPDAAAVAAVPEGDEPSSATADEAALAEVPSAGETADRDSSSGSVAGVKGTIPKRLGGDSVVDAPSPAFGGDLGVGVVGTEALAAELADEAVAGAGGEIDAVGGGNVSVASDAATAGTDVDIEARVASVEEPVVDAVAAAVAAALGGVTGAAEDVVPDVDVALDDVVVTAPVKVELEASAAPAVVMVADKGDTAAVSGGATLEGVPLETEAPMPGTDEEATAGTSRTLTAAAESRSAEKSDRKRRIFSFSKSFRSKKGKIPAANAAAAADDPAVSAELAAAEVPLTAVEDKPTALAVPAAAPVEDVSVDSEMPSLFVADGAVVPPAVSVVGEGGGVTVVAAEAEAEVTAPVVEVEAPTTPTNAVRSVGLNVVVPPPPERSRAELVKMSSFASDEAVLGVPEETPLPGVAQEPATGRYVEVVPGTGLSSAGGVGAGAEEPEPEVIPPQKPLTGPDDDIHLATSAASVVPAVPMPVGDNEGAAAVAEDAIEGAVGEVTEAMETAVTEVKQPLADDVGSAVERALGEEVAEAVSGEGVAVAAAAVATTGGAVVENLAKKMHPLGAVDLMAPTSTKEQQPEESLLEIIYPDAAMPHIPANPDDHSTAVDDAPPAAAAAAAERQAEGISNAVLGAAVTKAAAPSAEFHDLAVEVEEVAVVELYDEKEELPVTTNATSALGKSDGGGASALTNVEDSLTVDNFSAPVSMTSMISIDGSTQSAGPPSVAKSEQDLSPNSVSPLTSAQRRKNLVFFRRKKSLGRNDSASSLTEDGKESGSTKKKGMKRILSFKGLRRKDSK